MVKSMIIVLGLICFVCGCGKNNTQPTSAQPPTAPQAATPPVAPPATPVVAAEPPKAKPSAEVLSLDSLLSQIPTNQFTLSDDGGWDKFTMPKVQKWASDNLYGKRARVAVPALECNVAQDDANPKPDEWIIRLRIPGIHANYAGMGNRLFPVAMDGELRSRTEEPLAGTTFVFKCNEADARKWDAHCKDTIAPAIIEGDISDIAFTPRLVGLFNNIFVGYDTVVKLDNVAFAPSEDMEPIAVYLPELIGHVNGPIREGTEAILEVKRLDSSGNNQLVFMKYRNHDSKDTTNQLFSFPMIKEQGGGFQKEDGMATGIPCDDPPTDAQISAAKANWTK